MCNHRVLIGRGFSGGALFIVTTREVLLVAISPGHLSCACHVEPRVDDPTAGGVDDLLITSCHFEMRCPSLEVSWPHRSQPFFGSTQCIIVDVFVHEPLLH